MSQICNVDSMLCIRTVNVVEILSSDVARVGGHPRRQRGRCAKVLPMSPTKAPFWHGRGVNTEKRFPVVDKERQI